MGKKEKKVSIGGQAVLEGVMMRGKISMATAVRDSDGIIRVETKRLAKGKKPNRIFALPIIRGIVAFIDSLFGGIKVLMRSAEVYGEGEPSKFEKWLAKTFKINVFSVIGFISILLALGLAIFLFMWLPQTARGGLESLTGVTFNVWAKNFIEGGIKLIIFVLYIVMCIAFKDIRRTFMYHGAEHKTIACFESGKELTVENARTCSRIHDRCGTTFIVFVLLTSIVLFAVFESLAGAPLYMALKSDRLYNLVRILCKIAMLPLIAGLSYELLKALAKTNSPVFLPLKVPGMLLQRLTTREPDDQMLEVAITAFNKVMEMDNDQSIEEVSFELPKKRSELLKEITLKLKDNGIDEQAEAEWIIALKLGIKRDQVNSDNLVTPKYVSEIWDTVNERITGRPLWYCIGDTDFYGYTIKVDERVLIPRPETELLVENALKYIDENKRVLDLCTGSGAIAIAVAKQTSSKVVAIDVSEKAIELAKENANLNQADIEFVVSDLFENLKGEKFDVIISNPPYIKREDLVSLQKEVKDFEPTMALDGGTDGLDFYKKICKEAKEYLTENGVLIMECGYNQAQDVEKMLKGFSKVEIIKDYENIERIVLAVV